MSCAACSAKVERAVKAISGIKHCSVNLLGGVMLADGAEDEKIIDAVRRAGYDCALMNKDEPVPVDNGDVIKGSARRLGLSVFFLVILMYVSMGHIMWGFPLPHFIANSPLAIALIQLVTSGIVLVINKRFFINGFRGLIKLAPNMDSLIAIGSLTAYLWSVFVVFEIAFEKNPELLHGYLHELYFESAAMILALISLGKMLEEIAKGKTGSAISALMSLTPPVAHVLVDGEERCISSSELRKGDVFIVRPGESFPADGVVIKGNSTADESSLTGESIPVDKAAGSEVFAASINLSGYLECECTKAGENTLMGEIINTVSSATAQKAPIAKVADRVAGIFVPLIMALALITAVIWIIVNKDLPFALARGISVLVISCPCALGLATPVAIMVGSGIAARGGVLFRTAESLELSGRAKIVCLDKTGTVSEGKPGVSTVITRGVSEEELLSYAASLEYKSEHPLGRAVVEYAKEKGIQILDSEDFLALSGNGVRALIAGEETVCGSYKFIGEKISLTSEDENDFTRLANEGQTPVFFVRSGKLIGIIGIRDKIKEDSRAAISGLKSLGLRVVMLTGDNETSARAVAKSVGIDEVRAGILPSGKAEAVKELSSHGRVIMVGDGINDSPALVCADVGIAIGCGTDIAIESADVVLLNSSLTGVLASVKIGRAVLKTIKENLFWAFCYNIIGIPLAAGAFISLLGWDMNPMFGAAAMSISSFLVVMNALRLNLGKYFISKNNNTEEKKMIKLKVKGMMCPHCEARVKEALLKVEGVASAEANHKKKEATVELSKEVPAENLIDAIVAAGYSASL